MLNVKFVFIFSTALISLLFLTEVHADYNHPPFFIANGMSYYDIKDNSSLRLQNFSIAAWFRTSSDYFTDSLIVNKGGFDLENAGNNQNYGIWITKDEKISGGFEGSNGANYFVTSKASYNDTVWHYGVVTYDKKSLILYVDGKSVAILNTTAAPDSGGSYPLRIGANSQKLSRFFNGDIDEVRVWNRALTPSEVESQYNSNIFDNEGLVVYYNGFENRLLNTSYYYKDLVNMIKGAKKFVYTSTYYVEDYSDNQVISELVKAQQRGVTVRLIFDPATLDLYPSINKSLASKGIPFKIMSNHAKVTVIDNKTVYVGSANWNKNGLERNWEITMRSNNKNTINEAYIWLDRFWTTKSKIGDNIAWHDERYVNGNEYVDVLIGHLKTAKSVKVLMFEASYNFKNQTTPDSKVLNEIKNASLRGSDIKIIFDSPRYLNRTSGPKFLQQNKVPFKLDDSVSGTFERLHAKTILIDDQILFIGSENWTGESVASLGEASIVTRDSRIIAEWLELFNYKWSLAKDPPLIK